ncbi:MAG: RagB/SusD family nutrient uptake outer membrane protein [Bacteroidota bacterium]
MKIRYIFITAFLLMGSLACEDALNKVPLDAPSDATFFSNATELELAINGAYQSLYWRTGGVAYPMMIDNTTDLGFLRSDFSGLQTFSRGAHSAATNAFGQTWDQMYTGIGRCNNLLSNMERARAVVSEDFFNRIQAEALFLRSYYYSWLIALYGDVPFVETIPASVEEGEVARTSTTEIVERLFSDLDIAAQSLPASWGGSEEGRATSGAAKALKARIALWNGRYDVAAQAAREVMDAGTYNLFPDYEKLFTFEGIRSAEVILDLPHLEGIITTTLPREQGLRNTQCWSRMVPSQFIVDSYEAIDGLPIDESPLYDPANPFENRDPRLDASIIRPGLLFATYVFETHPDSVMTTRIIDGTASRVDNQDVLNPFATFTGYLWKKYTSEVDLPQNRVNSQLNFILMRYAEVLLTYAEAKIEAGDIDASVLEAINEVRQRAYSGGDFPAISTTDQDELRDIIRRERKVELADEGFRLIDIRRWGIAEEVMPGTLVGRPKGAYSLLNATPQLTKTGHPQYDGILDNYRSVDQRAFLPNRDYLWPIPQKDIDVNGQLTQNPGY